MKPADVLPYYLAVEPSPADAASAFAIVRPHAGGTDAGVSIVLEDRDRCTEVFRFSNLGLIRIAWSACGRLLAFAHDSTLMIRDESGALRLSSMAGNVQGLAYDERGRLWCLAGRRLEARVGDRVETMVEAVECAAIAEVAAYGCHGESGLCIHLHDGRSARQLGSFPQTGEPLAVELSMRGNYLAVVLGSMAADNRGRVRIVRFDLSTFENRTVMDQQVAFGFNGGPGMKAVVLGCGEVLAAYENGACTRVWALAPDAPARPVSPDGLEVFDFSIDPGGDRLAIIASDTRSPEGGFERQLVIGQKNGTEWRFLPPVPGVYQMPRWRHDGQLEVLCGDNGRWIRRVSMPDEILVTGDQERCRCGFVARGGVEYDYLRLPGPQNRGAGILLLPRLHQQFVAGAQSFFFHHLLYSIARALALDGYSVVTLNGPGAIGRGRVRREPIGSHFVQLRSAIQDLASSLRAEGCRTLGILAGSLAAVPALQVLGRGTEFAACAFVAPLFEASIPVTAPVRRHLLDDPLIAPLEKAAADVTVPLLILRGGRDEVVPVGQVTRLRGLLPPTTPVDLHVFEDEGHIFRNPQSWLRSQCAVERFFVSHLERHPTAA